MANVLAEDIENIIKNFDMSVFNNKTILITGATGLIGKLCVLSLLKSPYNINVLALVRDKDKSDRLFGTNSKLNLIIQDINKPINCDSNIDYIIHCASITASKDFIEKPVETILTGLNGTKNVLEFAKEKNAQGVIYLSSLEVYGIPSEENVKEDDYGYIDILNTRSSYSESKKIIENLCIAYAKEYNVSVKIARLSQTFGAGVEKEDNRVFAQFAKSVINKENIVLHTTGNTKRNYCYTTDAIRAIYTILTKGEIAQAYNVANKDTYISIANMAKNLENKNTKVVFEIDNANRGYNPEVKVNLDTSKLEALGWKALVNLDEMYERLIKHLKELG